LSTSFKTPAAGNSVHGLVEICDLDGTILLQKKNQLQYDWAAIAGKCIAVGDLNYRLRGMYLEYENVAAPGSAATLPDTSRGTTQAYYAGLNAVANRDFLRLPFATAPATTTDGEFTSHFAPHTGLGNIFTCAVITTGVAGFHGKPFATAGVNSKIAGLALVAMPIENSQAADLIFARLPLAAPEQILFSAGAQKLVRWHIAFQ